VLHYLLPIPSFAWFLSWDRACLAFPAIHLVSSGWTPAPVVSSAIYGSEEPQIDGLVKEHPLAKTQISSETGGS
jgi:hypothetical protein